MPHDDFATEPLPGLPELPPEGERILWQGKPDWWALTKDALNLYWVAGYFVFLALWRFGAVYDLMPFGQAFGASVPFLILGALVCGLLMLVGYVQAKSTVYTVTNRRVAMRVGAALTVTLNLPYVQIASADLALRKSGVGTITFGLLKENPLSYVMCWPHVRPWSIRRVQPALRCIPDARNIARLIADAAEARVSTPQVQRVAPPQSAAVAAE